MRSAGIPLLLGLLVPGLLLIRAAGCRVPEAEAEEVVPDAVPEDFAGQDGDITDLWDRELADDGAWEKREPFGRVWAPRVAKDWRPYTDGHWVETDQGWGWVAEESWGWAVYHYGRWFYAPERKWLWIPGSRWAPAWVAWRVGHGYVGWAPLPPTIGFVPSRGLDPGAAAISATHFHFIPERALLSTDLRGAILPAAQNAAILQGTTDITHYKMVRHRIFDLGISPRHVAGMVGQPLQRVTVASLAARAGTTRGLAPFYQPPSLARLAAKSRREFGSSSNERRVVTPGAEPAGRSRVAQDMRRRSASDPGTTRGANSSSFATRAGGHASVASRRGSSDRGARQPDRRAFFGAPSGRSYPTTRERGRTSAAGTRTAQAQAAQPTPFQPGVSRTMPLQRATFQPTRPAAGAFRFQAQQSAPFQAPSPPQSARGFPSAPPPQAHGAPARMPSAGGRRPP